jgi:hypothetical protein
MRSANGNRRAVVTWPPAVAFLGAAAMFATGVLIGGWPGAAVLCVLAALVAVLLAVTWPRLRPTERVVRVVVLLVLLAVAISVAR